MVKNKNFEEKLNPSEEGYNFLFCLKLAECVFYHLIATAHAYFKTKAESDIQNYFFILFAEENFEFVFAFVDSFQLRFFNSENYVLVAINFAVKIIFVQHDYHPPWVTAAVC